MKIVMHTGGIAQTNCYLLADEVARRAVLIDAPDHTAAAMVDAARKNGWTIDALWLTHGHFDHIADHAVVTAAFPQAKVLMNQLDEPMLTLPQSRLFALPFEIPQREVDEYLQDGQVLKVGSIEVKVIHTPGHSPGHVMFHLPAHHILFGGDLIIGGAVGRTDLPGGDYPTLQKSIRQIMQLPGDTKLFPGHGEAATLEHESQTNSYVQEAME